MIFYKTLIEGVYLINPEKHNDNRGFFTRTFDKNQFLENNIDFDIKQTSLSYNKNKGSVRGMHWQKSPYPERKIVQCVKGSINDVLIDLRVDSKTYNKWFLFKLNDENNLSLYIPTEIAHGFQTLNNDTTILYYMDQEYHPECSCIISHSDTKYNIKWELPITSISLQDLFCKSSNNDEELCKQKFA